MYALDEIIKITYLSNYFIAYMLIFVSFGILIVRLFDEQKKEVKRAIKYILFFFVVNTASYIHHTYRLLFNPVSFYFKIITPIFLAILIVIFVIIFIQFRKYLSVKLFSLVILLGLIVFFNNLLFIKYVSILLIDAFISLFAMLFIYFFIMDFLIRSSENSKRLAKKQRRFIK